MAKFERKGKGGQPKINTASLPDVVFMLLFFFMTVTTLRETEQLVIVKVPEASEVAKMERKDLTSARPPWACRRVTVRIHVSS